MSRYADPLRDCPRCRVSLQACRRRCSRAQQRAPQPRTARGSALQTMSPSSRLSLPRSVLQQGRDRSFVIAAQRIQIVTPPLVHPYPLIPIGRPVIDAADLIVVGGRERPFDRIGVPLAALVEKLRRRRANSFRRESAEGRGG